MWNTLRRLPALGVLVLGLVLAEGASAQLSQVELSPGSGDSKVTLDAATGFYWLDLPETTNLSVTDVLGGAGGWVPGGWRYATNAEICALFAAYALAVVACGTFQGGLATGDVVGTLQGFLGLTINTGTTHTTGGFYDDHGDPTRVGVARITYQIPGDQSDSLVQNSATIVVALPTFGNWLVRDTAPPAPMPLLPWSRGGAAVLLLIVGATAVLLRSRLAAR